MIVFSVQGEVPSKKNAWRRGARTMFIDKEMARILDQLLLQINTKRPPKPMSEQVSVELRFHGTYRTDLDNRVTTMLDLLQKGGIITNDRKVKHIDAWDAPAGREFYTEVVVEKWLV